MDQSGNRILLGDNLKTLRKMESASAELIYVDPPFNTGRTADASSDEDHPG